MKILPSVLHRENQPHFVYTLTQKPAPTDIVSTHIHYSYELLFFCDGDADCSIAGNIYHLQRNDLLLIKPSTYHNIILLSAHPYERIVSNFYESDIPSNLVSTLRSLSPIYHVNEGSPLEMLLNSMKDTQPTVNENDFEQFFSFALPMLILHLKNIGNQPAKEKLAVYSTIQKILFYIDKNPMKPLRLSDLSSTFYLSESHIAHLFKKHLNTSATQYINRKKITYAHSLIVSGMSPAQVAEICSYENYSTFYRHYKKYLGAPPMQHSNKASTISQLNSQLPLE